MRYLEVIKSTMHIFFVLIRYKSLGVRLWVRLNYSQMGHQYESIVRNAIEKRRSLLVQKQSLLILIEPYLFGMNRSYQHILFGFQTNGEGRGYQSKWVSIALNEVASIYTTERKFYSDAEGYEANKPDLQIVLCEAQLLHAIRVI